MEIDPFGYCDVQPTPPSNAASHSAARISESSPLPPLHAVKSATGTVFDDDDDEEGDPY